MSNEYAHTERRIVRKLVRKALGLGYVISVFDGEEWCLRSSTSEADIMSSIQSTESEELVFRTRDGYIVGAIVLVYGNGEDVITDYSDNMEMQQLIEGV